jgi:PAS domain S-box-containing protein
MNLRKKPLKKVNVLHIEGNIKITELVREHLNTSHVTKFEVISKTDLQSGMKYIEAACENDPDCPIIDVILLDLTLPNSKGVDTFLKVKKISKHIPIVIVSSHKDIACECVAFGAQDYLVKPDIPADVLIRSLKYAIQRNRLEQSMRNVIMTSILGYHIYEMNDDGEIIFSGYNPAVERLLNRDHKPFLNKRLIDIFPSFSEEVYNRFERTFNGEPWENQIIPYQDDYIGPTYFKINVYKTAPYQIAVTFEDISEQVYQSAALKESELKYRTLVEATRACIFGIDYKTNKFTYVNDVFSNFLGYTKDELINNTNVIDLLSIESKLTYRERLLSLKLGQQISSTCEYNFIKKDGSTVWFFTTSEYIEDSEKNIIGANVVAIDITQKKEAELKKIKKEREVYCQLEKQIKEWNDEMTANAAKKEEALKIIDKEILTMRESLKMG